LTRRERHNVPERERHNVPERERHNVPERVMDVRLSAMRW
jgi:hypothetical protein